MSKDLESKDLDALQLDEDPEENWEVEDDWEDDDFVDIDLDSGRTSEEDPDDIFERSERPVRKVEKVADDPYADHSDMEDVTSGRYRRNTEESSAHGRNSGGKSGGRFSGGKTYLILILVCLAIIAAIVVVLKMSGKSSTAGETSAASSEETTTTVSETAAWEENTNTAVIDLVNQYYTARTAVDMATLRKVLDPSVSVDESRVQAEAQVIEAYQNINCYTAPGISDGEYVVYISFNMKFKDIPTAAPGLVPAYVRPDSTGALKLLTWDTAKNDAEISAFMGTAADCDMIRQLAEGVNAAYQTAYSSDAALAEFLDSLNNTTAETTAADPNAETTVADSNAETTAVDPNAETTAAETTAAETTAAETTAAASGDFTEMDSMEYVIEDVKCRVQPNTDDSTDFTLVTGGTMIHVIGSNGEWYHVYLNDGTEGYIKAEFVSPYAPSATAQ